MAVTEAKKAENMYLASIAPRAYDFCVEHFGEPCDPHLPYQIHRDFSRSLCSHTPLLRCYMIEIDKKRHDQEQLCTLLGHEMYHRVTMRRSGVHRQPWLNEMLAYLTQQEFLRLNDYDDYAQYVEDVRLQETSSYSIYALRETKKRLNILARISGNIYTLEFAKQVQRFAFDLQGIVTLREAARLVGASSFESWMAQLSEEQQERIAGLMR